MMRHNHSKTKLFPPASATKTAALRRLLKPALACALLFCCNAGAQVNGVGERPYRGWSSFSEQTINNTFLTQANIQAQSDALLDSGLEQHGFKYINIDSGWMGSFDANGRPIPDTTTFPDIKGLADHIHANGQKIGIYWIPGIEQPAVTANYPVLGTQYHIQDILVTPYTTGNGFGSFFYKIDFTKPGSQEYVNSVVDLFASWGIDFIKLDGVTPGSDNDNLSIDNRADVAAWSEAIAQSGRKIWLTISWDLDEDFLSVWQQFANARRTDQDVECEGGCATLTDWPRIYERFRDLPGWENAASPSLGWNDLDSLDVGNGALDGLTPDEKRSAVTLWAIANAPMYLGGDLTKLDGFAKELLSNDDVLRIQHSGRPAQQVLGGDVPIWMTRLGNGEYIVALFNMSGTPINYTLSWDMIGLSHVVIVRDLWNQWDIPPSSGALTTQLAGHGTRLFRVAALGTAKPTHSTSYEAEAAVLSGTAAIAACPNCSGGEKVGNLGLGANNTVTFNNVEVKKAGVYLMEVDSMTVDLRSYIYTVNGGPPQTLNSGGGSFELPSRTTVPVHLNAGVNVIQFGNPVSYPPDLDRIVISGNGDAVISPATTYEAELATLSGSVSAGFSNYSSGLAKAGNIGGGPANSVTFSNVIVPSAGTYQLEIDYQTSGERSFGITINDGTPIELNLNGSTFNDPAVAIIPVQLNAGTNTIQFGNPTNYAPDLDRIVVAPPVAGQFY